MVSGCGRKKRVGTGGPLSLTRQGQEAACPSLQTAPAPGHPRRLNEKPLGGEVKNSKIIPVGGDRNESGNRILVAGDATGGPRWVAREQQYCSPNRHSTCCVQEGAPNDPSLLFLDKTPSVTGSEESLSLAQYNALHTSRSPRKRNDERGHLRILVFRHEDTGRRGYEARKPQPTSQPDLDPVVASVSGKSGSGRRSEGCPAATARALRGRGAPL